MYIYLNYLSFSTAISAKGRCFRTCARVCCTFLFAHKAEQKVKSMNIVHNEFSTSYENIFIFGVHQPE